MQLHELYCDQNGHEIGVGSYVNLLGGFFLFPGAKLGFIALVNVVRRPAESVWQASGAFSLGIAWNVPREGSAAGSLDPLARNFQKSSAILLIFSSFRSP
jgi:hypothetical protein